jgi:hypothetical protein
MITNRQNSKSSRYVRRMTLGMVCLIGTTSSVIAQSLSGPTLSNPDAPFSVREDSQVALDRYSAKLLAEATERSATVEKMANYLNKKAGEGVKLRNVGKAFVEHRRLERLCRQLIMLGETTGYGFDERADVVGDLLEKVRDDVRSNPDNSKAIAKELKVLKIAATRMKASLKKIAKKRQAKNWTEAEKMILAVTDDLREMRIWAKKTSDIRSLLDSYDDESRRVSEGVHQRRRTMVTAQLIECRDQNRVDLKKTTKAIAAAISAVGKKGVADWNGNALTGPELLGTIGALWRKLQRDTMRLRAINWTRGRVDGTAVSRDIKKIETSYKKFHDGMIKSIGQLISSDAKRVNEQEAPALYRAYIKAIALLLARGDRNTLERAVASPLKKLAGKSRTLQADIKAYQSMTAEILQWRRQVAGATAAHLLDEQPSTLKSVMDDAFLADRDREYDGLFSNSTSHPFLRGPIAPVMRYAAEPLRDQEILVESAFVATGAVEARKWTSWYQRGFFVETTGKIDLSAATKALEDDLLASDGVEPLTLTAAVALQRAKLGDLADLYGTIKEVELLSMLNLYRSLPTDGETLFPLGALSKVRSRGAAVVRAVSVRVTVAPQWVRTPYFVIEMDRPPVAELPPEVSEEAAEDKPPEPAEQAE